MKGIRDAKDLNSFVERMAAGRSAAAAKRASSTAPPSPVVKPKRTKAAAPNPDTPNKNTVVGADTHIPAPASGVTLNIRIGR